MNVWYFSLPLCAACGTAMTYIMETSSEPEKSYIRAWCVKEFCKQMGKQIRILASKKKQI